MPGIERLARTTDFTNGRVYIPQMECYAIKLHGKWVYETDPRLGQTPVTALLTDGAVVDGDIIPGAAGEFALKRHLDM